MQPERRRLILAEAEALAAELITILAPACERIEIAGSIRRRKPDVGDIELVLIGRITRTQTDLFGQEHHERNHFDELCDQLLAEGVFAKRVGKGGSTAWGYGIRRAWYGDVAVDLFGTEPERFGLTMMIRTGSSDWNMRWVTQKNAGGRILPYGMRVADGWLWRGNHRIATPEEVDVFREIGLPYREPWERS